MTQKALSGNRATSSDKEHFLGLLADQIARNDWKKVKETCKTFAEAVDYSAEIPFIHALTAFAEEDFVGAISFAEDAFKVDSNVRQFADFLAVLYVLVGELTKSLYYAKLATALPSVECIQNLISEDMPRLSEEFLQVKKQPLLRRAIAALGQRRWLEAEHWFRQEIEFDAGNLEAYKGLANCLSVQGRCRDGIEALRAARHLAPEDPEIASQLGTSLMVVGEFAESRACHRWAMAADEGDAGIHAQALMDLLADPAVNPKDHAMAFRHWGERFGVDIESAAARPLDLSKERFIIGYFVGPLGRRKHGPAISKILAAHNQDRFLCVGFGYGQLTDELNIPFQKSFDSWHNVQTMDPITLGSMIAAERVDIMVDLCGFVTPALLTAFGQRMAPIQITGLGSPFGTGLAGMDALLTDQFLDPEGGDSSLYKENPAFLESGSLILGLPAADDKSSASGGASENDSEEHELTFAADAPLGELTPNTVAAWSRILHAMPDAKLILANHDFHTEANAARLVELFGDFGVAHRVDVIKEPDSVAFFRFGDICLLPLHTLRPDIVVNALAAGLPVICPAGTGRHTRQVGSVLCHLGLGGDMVASTDDDYVELALGWARDERRRREFGGGIGERMQSAPFFDPAVRASELEKAFESLWRQTCEMAAS